MILDQTVKSKDCFLTDTVSTWPIIPKPVPVATTSTTIPFDVESRNTVH